MSYNCTLYLNSGFNAVNIPDSPALLEKCESLTVPALDILQDRDLSSIRVKATFSQVTQADYLCLSNGTAGWYYIITAVRMLATDCAEFAVIPDYITSAGGPAALTILDGMTDRVCVSDDSFGLYTQDDPYLAPSETPNVVYTAINPGANTLTYVFVETTLDLIQTGTDQTAVTYTDSSNGETVTVPQTVAASSDTGFSIASYGDNAEVTAPSAGTAIYDGKAEPVQEGIKRARGIVENPVLKRVSIPTAFVETTAGGIDNLYSKITGRWGSVPTGLPFVYSSNAKNKRLLYGQYNKYGIVTTSGAKTEYNPEDIYRSGLDSSGPIVGFVGDPHLDGRPYFRFETVKGSQDMGTRNFFIGAAPGSQWANTPLIYEDKAGNALDTIQFDYNMQNRQNGYDNLVRNTAMGLVGSLIGISGNVGVDTMAASYGGGTNLLSTSTNIVNFGNNFKTGVNNLDIYSNITKMEAAQYLASTGANMPEIAIPYNNSFYRDFYGNGAIAYRYYYTDHDLDRLDKVLTMYGYKYMKTLESSDFTNRQYFNYVQSSISVGGLPRWFADGIAAQLRGGTRIWHVLPTVSAYDNNPIVTS